MCLQPIDFYTIYYIFTQINSLLLIIIRCITVDWRDCSVVTNTCCSCRESGMSSQNPRTQGNSQPPAAPVPGNLRPSSGPHRLLHAHSADTDKTHMHTNKIRINKSWVWREVSVVGNTRCSREPEFSFQHPPRGAHSCLRLQLQRKQTLLVSLGT